jgi:hypothetical protein
MKKKQDKALMSFGNNDQTHVPLVRLVGDFWQE